MYTSKSFDVARTRVYIDQLWLFDPFVILLFQYNKTESLIASCFARGSLFTEEGFEGVGEQIYKAESKQPK